MTTHTLTGIAIYSDTTSNEILGLDSAGVTHEFVVSDTVTSLSYSEVPTDPSVPPFANLMVDAYHVWLDGEVYQPPEFPLHSFVSQINWTDGGGIVRSTIVMDYLEFDVSVDGLGAVDVEYMFIIGGDAFPPLTTISDYNSVQSMITGFSSPTGTYGPDTAIAFTLLGGTVSEDDVINGDDFDNELLGGLGDDTILGFDGVDTLRGGLGNDTLTGGTKADKLVGGSGNDVLNGSKGNDRLFGGADDDRLYGGFDEDYLSGGAGNDLLNGGLNKDKLFGDGGDDRLFGEGSDDRLFGGDGADVLFGGDQHDILSGGRGADQMFGGKGNDTVSYQYHPNQTGKAIIDLADDTANAGIALGDTYTSIESATGGAGNDRIYGSSVRNWLQGGAGDDRIDGRGGDDFLIGGEGWDILFGGDGNDYLLGGSLGGKLIGGAGDDVLRSGLSSSVMNGGTGRDRLNGGDFKDTATYTDATTGIWADLGQYWVNTGEARGDKYFSIENLTGSDHADKLWGDSHGNKLRGGDGDDQLYGRLGADKLIGGGGDDRLNGGDGNDILKGNLGNDIFVFSEGLDVVTDFETTGNDEKIDLRGAGPITGFTDLISNHVSDSGGNVVIDDLGGNILTLNNVTIADLDAGDFIF